MRKKTHNEFVKEVEEIAGYDKYEFLTEYQGANYKIKIKCKKDNYIWDVTPHSFLTNKCKCPKCSNCVKNKDTNYFKNELKELYGDEYICLGEYKNSREKVLLKHTICNNEFFMSPDAILHKNGCPICNHRKGADKLFISHEDFCKRVEKIFGDEFEILSPYKGYKEYVKVKHNKCGKIYDRLAGDIMSGKGCKYCGQGGRRDTEWYKEEVDKKYKGEYTILGEYVRARDKILTRHNVCKNTYYVAPTCLLNDIHCPICNQSKGELKIKSLFDCLKIKNSPQYTFYDLYDKDKQHPLRFDFAVIGENNEISFLIEYDGEFHYKKMYDEHDFEGQKRRDKLKDDYCSEHNIDLLRIPYWKFNNIEEIIKNKLKEKGLI